LPRRSAQAPPTQLQANVTLGSEKKLAKAIIMAKATAVAFFTIRSPGATSLISIDDHDGCRVAASSGK
jgi:hypothetical protein